MNSFCYFVPDVQVVVEKSLPELGLDHALTGGFVSKGVTGPAASNGARGVMLCGKGYDLPPVDSLEWYPPPVDDMAHPRTWWLGVPAELPGPELLRRDTQFPGEEVKLGDSNEWLIPHARRVDGLGEEAIRYACCLPSRWRLVPGTSELGMYVLDEYRELYEASELASDLCIEQPIIYGEYDVRHRFTMGDAIELVSLALSVNYRMSFWEVNALGLVTDGSFGDVASALCDMKSCREWLDAQGAAEMPNFPDGDAPDSASGEPDSTLTTDPPSANSRDLAT